MGVGSSRRQDAEFGGELGVMLDLRRLMRRVVDLDPVEANLHERGNVSVSKAESGMGECGDTAQVVDETDHLLHRCMRLRHGCRPAIPNIAIESFFLAGDSTAVNEGGCDVGPADDPVAGVEENVVDGDLDTEIVEPGDDGIAAGAPVLAQSGEEFGEGLALPVYEVGQQVNFSGCRVGAELSARNQLDARTLCGGDRFADPFDRVVICQAEGPYSRGGSFFDRLRWRSQPIGAKGMDVEVGEIKLQ